MPSTDQIVQSAFYESKRASIGALFQKTLLLNAWQPSVYFEFSPGIRLYLPANIAYFDTSPAAGLVPTADTRMNSICSQVTFAVIIQTGFLIWSAKTAYVVYNCLTARIST